MGDTTSSRPYLSYRMIKTGTTEGRIRRLTVPQVMVYRYAEPVRLTEHRTSDCSAIIGAAARQAPDEARHPSGATQCAGRRRAALACEGEGTQKKPPWRRNARAASSKRSRKAACRAQQTADVTLLQRRADRHQPKECRPAGGSLEGGKVGTDGVPAST